MPDTATKLVVLKVYNVKLSFDIWLVLYIYFILYFWQYSSFKIYNSYMKVVIRQKCGQTLGLGLEQR